MVDTPLIFRKLSELETYYKQIKEFQHITYDTYVSDWKTQRIVERTLQIMIETCTDIANHIISDEQLRTPVTYSDTFKVLCENNIIPVDLFDIMVKMVKFRNIIVHQYERVDSQIVIVILKKHIDDFIYFKNAIVKYLQHTMQ
ncbi:MAG TPA: DUF86 domain-containing protein [Spirochaetota bacterium]|nr:DUF86 domain-containing protein [Spirochaetota bacterium]HOM11646.1 DUF86 domain-containing protein [Spirochaetota bacterium]HPP51254.1 DUF86 domain-containing protein [Spirochaetota bacterium]